MQEIPILGTSFLDEEAQSYPGELGYQQKIDQVYHVWNPERRKLRDLIKSIFSASMSAGV
jgi:hypothetical protein